jgi:hypothetical protein
MRMLFAFMVNEKITILIRQDRHGRNQDKRLSIITEKLTVKLKLNEP